MSTTIPTWRERLFAKHPELQHQFRADSDAIEELGSQFKNEEIAALRSHIERMEKEGEAKRHQAIGEAIERACAELPIGFDVEIYLERDAGTVRLCAPDGYTADEHFDADTFDMQITRAIDAAIEAEKGKGDGLCIGCKQEQGKPHLAGCPIEKYV